MMPFTNLIQLPGAQALPGGIKAVRGSDGVDATTSAGENHGLGDGGPRVFMAWLHQLMNRSQPEGGTGSGVTREDQGDLTSAIDALHALIDEAAALNGSSSAAILADAVDACMRHPSGSDGVAAQVSDSHPPLFARVHHMLAAVHQTAVVPTEDGTDGTPAFTVPSGGPSEQTRADHAVEPIFAGHRGSTLNPTHSQPLDVPTDAATPAPTGKGGSDLATSVIHSRNPRMGSPDDTVAPTGPGADRAPEGPPAQPAQRGADEGRTFPAPWPDKKHETGLPPETSRHPASKRPNGAGDGFVVQDTEIPADKASTARGDGRAAAPMPANATGGNDSGGEPLPAVEPSKAGTGDAPRTSAPFHEAAPSVAGEKMTGAGQSSAPHAAEPTVKGFQAAIMDQIVQQARVRTVAGRSEILIRLKPEFLGHVQMHVASERQQIVVRLVTDQPVVKEIIENHLTQLKAELHHQGLTIDKFEVMVDADADPQHQRESLAHQYKHPSMPGRRASREQATETMDQDAAGHRDADPSDGEGVNYFA